MSLPQFWLLKGKIPNSWQWVVASTIGHTLPIALLLCSLTLLTNLGLLKLFGAIAQRSPVMGFMAMASAYALYGAIALFCQWLVLKQYFRRANKL